ncbi:MAG: 30S ribosomal protein S6 [Nitrospirota bacterium]|jgi:small subunit ribosomal protein S6
MRLYETIFIARSDLSDEQVETVATGIKGVVTGNGGDLVKDEDWGVKALAYDVDHHSKGRYYLLQFHGDNDLLEELERNYRYNESIIKFMTIRVDEK